MDYYEEFTSNFDNSNRCLLLCHYQTIHIEKSIQLLFMNLQKNIEVAAHSSDINQYRNHEKEKQLPTKNSFIVTKF